MVSGFSISSKSCAPVSWSIGVVTMLASLLCSRSSSTSAKTFLESATSVRLITMVPAFSIWLLKNSPKFFIYILHLVASTMVTALFSLTSRFFATSRTAFITSESLPTPDGSMMTRSGLYLVSTSSRDLPKSPTREQQIQPEFISRISMPESFKNPPSIPIWPNSFSIRTTCSPLIASCKSFLINVVFPAPKKPEMISIFVMMIPSFLYALPVCRQQPLLLLMLAPDNLSLSFPILSQNSQNVNMPGRLGPAYHVVAGHCTQQESSEKFPYSTALATFIFFFPYKH